jgi:2-polyprenyl-3-methyl-5-hydroxy-6-metoxy-1,4-benzoquinol methylase
MNNKEVINYYEHYREEDRITTNNARRIEYLTTIAFFDKILNGKLNILDCAAGTGAYAFYLADKGHKVTATDITPRHISYINEKLKEKPYHMDTSVLDATDMSCFSDESFDVVLNMGPFYHLIDEQSRIRCVEESTRVLKKGGLLATAYIPRFYLNQMIVMSNDKYVDKQLLEQIKETGVLNHDDPKCFWTDTYYSSFDEMQELYEKYNLEIVEHFAQDGLAPLFAEKVDKWNAEQFKIWLDYHMSVCTEKSIIGMSNHVIIIGRKR